ncbi:uncharacterized protein K460DRAFT_83777 [Cucurbitaria berberidis CBS 394.84]|uniref:Uncharacterized protein n=1 Tax=Cucurbitaria berberidis CBS 394.84 TaxID=1168544 RepID=A0A9P4GPW9_9PLEO|nr:uncharacterized protein K460DRAFT_83777 [Cucurbitaria berberidis CBS 394.84]KAF1848981.1 hypothetical protein K460DRAFT_83777 [Cucurbitaria berberidis CBS 394.84]
MFRALFYYWCIDRLLFNSSLSIAYSKGPSAPHSIIIQTFIYSDVLAVHPQFRNPKI